MSFLDGLCRRWHATVADTDTLIIMGDSGNLRKLITELAVIRGPVTLSSGQRADFYVDLRRVTLHHLGAPLVGRVMRALTADWEYDAVGGLTLGADPVATAMLHAAAAEGVALERSWSVSPTSTMACNAGSRDPTWRDGECWRWRTHPPPATACLPRSTYCGGPERR